MVMIHFYLHPLLFLFELCSIAFVFLNLAMSSPKQNESNPNPSTPHGQSDPTYSIASLVEEGIMPTLCMAKHMLSLAPNCEC